MGELAAERSYRFDGFKLGDLYRSAVMSRAPYDRPCDNDPIDKRNRRFMVYGGLPCRRRAFPEQTTVAFYLRYDGRRRYEQPILAFAWMGGHYFDKRSNFPIRVGEPTARANAVFGRPLMTFRLQRWSLRRVRRALGLEDPPPSRRYGLTVTAYRGDVHALSDGDVLVGFVVGPMPDDPKNEQWRGLAQMYRRYTPKPPR